MAVIPGQVGLLLAGLIFQLAIAMKCFGCHRCINRRHIAILTTILIAKNIFLYSVMPF